MQAVHQHVVDHAEDVVVHPGPHLRRHRRRDGPGDEHGRAQQPAAPEVGVDGQRDNEPEDRLEEDRGDREDNGVADRVQECRILQQIGVITDADELDRTDGAQTLVGEAEQEGSHQRVERDDRYDKQAWQNQEPPQPLAPPRPRRCRPLEQ